MDSQIQDFRNAMRRLASGVCLITAGDRGMAATAVMSLTAEPPTLAIAVNRSASLFQALQAEELFCVNVLAQRHGDLVGRFSGAIPREERFLHGDWTLAAGQPPVLNDALVSLVCRQVQALETSTHVLFVGEVVRTTSHPAVDPLIWLNGACAGAIPLPTETTH